MSTRSIVIAMVVAATIGAGAASAQPFHHQVTISIPVNAMGGSAWINVPAGKRLVIEHVSMMALLTTGSGQNVSAWLYTDTGGAAWRHFLAPAQNVGNPFGAPSATSSDAFVTSHPIRLYADPGTRVGVSVGRHGPRNSAGTAVISISGNYATP